MPSPMEGSSREGDLFTVKHELKNGKWQCIVKSSVQSSLFFYTSLKDTCLVEMLALSRLAWETQLLSVGIQ